MHSAQFTITGRLTKDVEIRQGANGDYALLKVATEKTYRNANGQQDKKTYFHSLICFKSALMNYLSGFKKGNLVTLTGEIIPTESTDGNGNRTFDNKLELADAKNFGGGNNGNGQNYQNQNQQQNNGNGQGYQKQQQNNGYQNRQQQQNNGNGQGYQNRQQQNNGYQNRQQQQNNGNGQGYQNQQQQNNGYQNNGGGFQDNGNDQNHDYVDFDNMQPQGDFNPYPDNV